MGESKTVRTNKKCAAGRLRTKNAGLHLLRHKLFVSKDKSAKNETAFLPKMWPYLLKRYLFVPQGQYSISFRKMQIFFAHAAGDRQHHTVYTSSILFVGAIHESPVFTLV